MSAFSTRCWSSLIGKWPALASLDAATAGLIIDGSLEACRRVGRQDGNGIPPSVEEVQDFVQAHGLSVVPADFIDFYASKDWKVGKARMVNWEAACRRWSRRESQLKGSQGHASLYALQQELKGVENDLNDILYPGGSAFKLMPTGEKLVRFERLKERRIGLLDRIEAFATSL